MVSFFVAEIVAETVAAKNLRKSELQKTIVLKCRKLLLLVAMAST